jgi:hypothetical protein
MILVLAALTVPFDYSGALRPGQTLAIRDINGSVRVRTGDRFSVHALKRAERSDPSAVAIRVENRSNGVLVCVRYPPDANRSCDDAKHSDDDSNNDTSVAFEVTVPHGVTVDARNVNGSVDVVNDGPTDASSVNGSVRAEGRDVRTATTVNGSVTVTIHDRSRGTLDAKTVNGSIDVTLPPGSGLTVDAKTLTGGITAAGLNVERPRYGPGASVSGTLGDGGRRLNLHTVNGSITLH